MQSGPAPTKQAALARAGPAGSCHDARALLDVDTRLGAKLKWYQFFTPTTSLRHLHNSLKFYLFLLDLTPLAPPTPPPPEASSGGSANCAQAWAAERWLSMNGKNQSAAWAGLARCRCRCRPADKPSWRPQGAPTLIADSALVPASRFRSAEWLEGRPVCGRPQFCISAILSALRVTISHLQASSASR